MTQRYKKILNGSYIQHIVNISFVLFFSLMSEVT